LATGIASTDTTIQVASGSGSLFPNPSNGDYFYITLVSVSLPTVEIVQCTARSGDVLTVVRGQEGTSPQPFNIGDGVQLRITAAGMNYLVGASSVTTEEQVFTATQGQTVFNLTNIDYVPNTNSLAVFVNGSKQVTGVNYTETNVTTFTLTTGANAGDIVEAVSGLGAANGTLYATDIKYNEGGTGAVTTNVQAKLAQTVSAKDFGVDPTGVNDSTTALLNGIAYAKTAKCILLIPSGTYILSGATTIEIDVGLMSMVGQGIVVFDCSAMTATYAFQVYNSLSYPTGQEVSPLNKISGIKFIGNNTATKNGIYLAHPTYAQGCNILIENCSFVNFDNNMTFGSNVWRADINHCYSAGATTSVVHFESGATNAGESMGFYSCQFVGSKFLIEYPAQINLYSCSILVCQLKSTVSSVILHMYGGNIENPGSAIDQPYINIVGATNWFGLHGTGITMNTFSGSFTSPLFNITDATSTMVLFGVLLPETSYYTASTIDTYSYCGGAGRILSYGGMYFPAGGAQKPSLSAGQSNSVYNYGFETGNTNGWVVTPYGTSGSTAVASATAKDHGTYGLLATSVDGGGINISQTVPCVAGQLIRANCNVKVASSTTSTVAYVQVSYTTANGTTIATYGQSVSNTTTSWTSVGGVPGGGGTVNLAPAGAAYVTFNLNVQPGSGGSNVVYFDDAVLNIC
jgi:hypothetical protein